MKTHSWTENNATRALRCLQLGLAHSLHIESMDNRITHGIVAEFLFYGTNPHTFKWFLQKYVQHSWVSRQVQCVICFSVYLYHGLMLYRLINVQYLVWATWYACPYHMVCPCGMAFSLWCMTLKLKLLKQESTKPLHKKIIKWLSGSVVHKAQSLLVGFPATLHFILSLV